LTQEAAAEKLGISVESIRAYETGVRIPPNEIVEPMVICYNAQHLAYQHLHETNNLMGKVVPELTERDMLKVCVRIYNRIRHIANQGELDKLLLIAEDGVIDNEERSEFDHILDELREIIKGGLELSVYCDLPSE
jgi:transcriptional regulator with XRE-family HTH domain